MRCVQMSRFALCSVCDGDVGVGIKARANLVKLCPSFCKRWFDACAEDFFAPGSTKGRVTPCGPGSFVCSPLEEIMQDPVAFCSGIGDFVVAESEDPLEDACYDGVPAALSKGKGPRARWDRPQPYVKPWWRRLLDRIQYHWVTRWLEENTPGIVIACCAAIFAWYLFTGD